jgi:hypothetical protein
MTVKGDLAKLNYFPPQRFLDISMPYTATQTSVDALSAINSTTQKAVQIDTSVLLSYASLSSYGVTPSAPGTPTLTQVARNIGGDGTTEISVKAQISPVTNAISYVFSVSDGTDLWYYPVADPVIKFPATSGLTYTVAAKAIGFPANASGFGASATISPAAKSSLPTTPAGLAATGQHKRVKLSWTKCPDKDFKRTLIFSSTSNDFTTATETGRTAGTRFIDDNLANATTYYYWIIHEDRSDNQSAKYPSSNTAGVNATTVRLVDDDTDPTGPGAPTGVTLTQRTNIDEDGKAVLELKVTWTAPSGISAKAGYEVNFNDGTDSWNIKSDDLLVRYPVRSNVLYTVKVRAVSFNGVKGSYSTVATITPAKKATAPTTAAGLTIAANHKRNKLKWTQCPDNDYKHTAIYRGTTSTFGSAAIIDYVKGSAFIDDNLTPGTTYYYWVGHIDQSGNTGTVSSSVNGAATKLVAGDYASGSIADADTDQTVLGAPTGLSLVQQTVDVDEDGKADIGIIATWSALTGTKTYELEVTEAGTIIDHLKATNLKKKIKAKSNKLYSIRIRAFSFNGTPGSWSSAVTITPVKKSAMVTAPTSLTTTPKLKGTRLRWSKQTDADYKETIVYRFTADTIASAVEIDRVTGTTCVDSDALTTGSTYYYWVAHVDRSGNVSAKWPTVNGVSAVYAVVTAADTDATVLGAPSCLNSASTTVTSACYVVQDNQDVNGDGTVDIAVTVSWLAVSGAVRYEVEVSRSDTSGGTFTVIGASGLTSQLEFTFAANTNKYYKARVRAYSFNGIAGSWATNVVVLTASTAFISYAGFNPSKKSSAPAAPSNAFFSSYAGAWYMLWTSNQEADYAYTEVWFNDTNSFGSSTLFCTVTTSAMQFPPPQQFVWLFNVDKSGNKSAPYAFSITPNIVFDTYNYAALSVTTAKINDGAVTISKIASNILTGVDRINSGTGVSATGGSTTSLQTLTTNHTTKSSGVLLLFQFKNNTGGARTMDIEIYNSTLGTLWTQSGVVLGDQEQAFIQYFVGGGSLSGASTDFKLRVTPVTTATLNQFKMTALSFMA